MASVSSIRSKEWRAKRKDDAEFWEKERKRKREARQSRSAEEKQRDRELSKKRQKRFRERKKLANYNVPVLPVDLSIDDNGSRVQVIDDNEGLPGELTTSNHHTFHVSVDMDLDKGPEDIVCESVDSEGDDNLVFLCNVDGNSWHKNSKPLTEQFGSKGTESVAIISVNDGEEREAYFKRIQAILSGLEDFDLLQRKCNEFSNQIEEMYPIGNLPKLDMTGCHLDKVASSLYPHEDAPHDFVPVQIVGDGNCLPRVGSLFAFGNEKHYNEIRVRVFIELCQYEHYYLDDSYLQRGTKQGIADIAKTLSLVSDVLVLREEDGVRLAFREYVKKVLKTNTFNGMWSIFALSSVLGVQISSIYPLYSGYIVRPHLHRLVMPRVFRQEKSNIVHIMWTSTLGKQREPMSWTPNHFVAVVPTSDETPTPSETNDLPMQLKQSGSHPVANSFSSTLAVLGSDKIQMESLSPNNDESLERPTTHFLKSVSKKDETIGFNGKIHPKTALLLPTGQGDTTQVNNLSISHSDEHNVSDDLIEQHGAMDSRSEDRCPAHSTEQLLYLCTTCGALPICYKCHLQRHLRHTFEDLKMYLANNERIYLQKITKKHEDDLKREISQQKQIHVENMESIDKEIKAVFGRYKDLLEKKSESDKQNAYQIRTLESLLEDTDTFTEKARARLKSLPVSERLSVMTADPRTDKTTNITRLANHVLIIEHDPPIDLSESHTALDLSEPHTQKPYHGGNQHQWDKATGDRPASLPTDHDPETSGCSTASGFPAQTYGYFRGVTLPDNRDPVHRVTTDTCRNVMPLRIHGLQDDRTGVASEMSTRMDKAVTNDISALSNHSYQSMSYGNATYNDRGYLSRVY